MIHLAEPSWLWLLWAAPLLALIGAWHVYMIRSARLRFAAEELLGVIGGRPRTWPRATRGVLIALALVLIVIALAQPQWNPQQREVQRTGRDVVFLIDVSRSMLARDLAPNRLDRARLWIKDLISSFEGDRVGIVAFAGAPVVKCPLTLDYGFFSLVLDELSPESAPMGGTNIGDAIRKALSDVFDRDAASEARDIILITDGEDQESFPVDAASLAGQAGVRIVALGIGSDVSGAPVPAAEGSGGGQVLRQDGQPVLSRQDAETLRNIAAASTGGVYLNVGTGTIDLERVYRDLIRSAAQQTTGSTDSMVYDEGYQYLLAFAVLVLVLEVFVHDRS